MEEPILDIISTANTETYGHGRTSAVGGEHSGGYIGDDEDF